MHTCFGTLAQTNSKTGYVVTPASGVCILLPLYLSGEMACSGMNIGGTRAWLHRMRKDDDDEEEESMEVIS